MGEVGGSAAEIGERKTMPDEGREVGRMRAARGARGMVGGGGVLVLAALLGASNDERGVLWALLDTTSELSRSLSGVRGRFSCDDMCRTDDVRRPRRPPTLRGRAHVIPLGLPHTKRSDVPGRISSKRLLRSFLLDDDDGPPQTSGVSARAQLACKCAVAAYNAVCTIGEDAAKVQACRYWRGHHGVRGHQMVCPSYLHALLAFKVLTTRCCVGM